MSGGAGFDDLESRPFPLARQSGPFWFDLDHSHMESPTAWPLPAGAVVNLALHYGAAWRSAIGRRALGCRLFGMN